LFRLILDTFTLPYNTIHIKQILQKSIGEKKLTYPVGDPSFKIGNVVIMAWQTSQPGLAC